MRKIYNFLTFIYNFISTISENFIFKNIQKNNEFYKIGFFKFNNIKNFELTQEEIYLININKYYKRIILSKSELTKLINFIFIECRMIEKITNETGFNYSIDFFTAYETASIELQDEGKGWYANQPHKDKPFSKNTLKLIIPLQNITIKDGPMKIINKTISKNYNINDNIKFENVTCNINEVFLFNPNICYHHASSPEIGRQRKQMMFQLNLAKKWNINQKIHSRQNRQEPKFPFFSYLFNKKINLELS